jgi:hypothetical protein
MSRIVLGVTLNFLANSRICPRVHILTVNVPGRNFPAEKIAITSSSVRTLRVIFSSVKSTATEGSCDTKLSIAQGSRGFMGVEYLCSWIDLDKSEASWHSLNVKKTYLGFQISESTHKRFCSKDMCPWNTIQTSVRHKSLFGSLHFEDIDSRSKVGSKEPPKMICWTNAAVRNRRPDARDRASRESRNKSSRRRRRRSCARRCRHPVHLGHEGRAPGTRRRGGRSISLGRGDTPRAPKAYARRAGPGRPGQVGPGRRGALAPSRSDEQGSAPFPGRPALARARW